MVETNPQAGPPVVPQPEGKTGQPPLQLPAVASGFDFASFLIAVFVVAVLATGAVFGYRFLILERTLTEQKQQISQLESELADPELTALDKKIQEIAGGIDKIRPILEDPLRFAELFWTLRKVTEKGVRWTSLGFNETQQLSMTGEALGWGQVARQLAILKQDAHFTDVELASASLAEDRIQFSVTTQVDTSKLVPPTTP